MAKVNVVQTSKQDLEDIVSGVLEKTLAQDADKKRKEEHINKVLKKDTIVDKKNKLHKHDDICPGCSVGTLESLGSGVHKCTGPNCGQMSLDKDAEFVICPDCGGIVPKSYLGTEKGCPNCGGSKVRPE